MTRLNHLALNKCHLNFSTAGTAGIPKKNGVKIPSAIRDSMVLWYDLKKQGATNESMAENPVLRDLSGNGHDATCYNFAWSGMSGVGGYATNFNTWLYTDDTNKIVVTDNTLNIIYRSQGYQNIRYNSLNALTIRIKANKECSFYIIVRYKEGSDDERTIPINKDEWTQIELPALSSNEVILRWAYFSDYGTDIIIEQETLYPNALVSDGVDDYCLVEGLPNIHSLLIKYSTLEQASTSWRYLYNTEISGAEDKDRWYCAINPDNGALESAPSISDDGYAQKMNNIVTNNRSFEIFKYRGGEKGAFALYSLILFNRTLTSEEIEWVKTNLMSE